LLCLHFFFECLFPTPPPTPLRVVVFCLCFSLLWENFYISLDHINKRYFCDLCQRMFCLFSSKNFIEVGLIFMSLIHFEFIFVYGARECSNFTCKHVSAQISQLHLLKSLVLSPLYVFVSFVID